MMTDTTRAVMLPLSGRPAGQITIVLAERIAAALEAHRQCGCDACRDPGGDVVACCHLCVHEDWPCKTYRLLSGEAADD